MPQPVINGYRDRTQPRLDLLIILRIPLPPDPDQLIEQGVDIAHRMPGEGDKRHRLQHLPPLRFSQPGHQYLPHRTPVKGKVAPSAGRNIETVPRLYSQPAMDMVTINQYSQLDRLPEPRPQLVHVGIGALTQRLEFQRPGSQLEEPQAEPIPLPSSPLGRIPQCQHGLQHAMDSLPGHPGPPGQLRRVAHLLLSHQPHDAKQPEDGGDRIDRVARYRHVDIRYIFHARSHRIMPDQA